MIVNRIPQITSLMKQLFLLLKTHRNVINFFFQIFERLN